MPPHAHPLVFRRCERLLIASHNIPWKNATNDQRLDVDNGILLSPTYDALFDIHLITFGPNGKIELSRSINDAAFQQIGVTSKEVLNRPLTDGVRSYLEVHNGADEQQTRRLRKRAALGERYSL